MTYTVVVVVHENNGIVTLVDAAHNVIAVSDAYATRDFARDFFGIVDALCESIGVKRDSIVAMTTESTLSDSAITQRAVRTIEHVFTFARGA